MIVYDLASWGGEEIFCNKDTKNRDIPPPGERLKTKTKTRNVDFYLTLLCHNPVQCFCSLNFQT